MNGVCMENNNVQLDWRDIGIGIGVVYFLFLLKNIFLIEMNGAKMPFTYNTSHHTTDDSLVNRHEVRT